MAMNWGKWILLSFALFAIFMTVMVTVCIRQEVSLVSRNYYKEELAYQRQIDRMTNTDRLKNKPKILIHPGVLEIQFGDAGVEQGELKLLRPSDQRLDRHFTILPEAVNRFDISRVPAGMYRAKVNWRMNGKEYYLEEVITL